MKDSNGSTFFADTDGSATIYDILCNNDISIPGKYSTDDPHSLSLTPNQKLTSPDGVERLAEIVTEK